VETQEDGGFDPAIGALWDQERILTESTAGDRFARQIRFVLEADKLKQVKRMNLLVDGSRRENSVEHSWHVALMVLLLGEYAAEPEIDRLRVIKMLLIHDLVEIDAGDTYCYDEQGARDQEQRERQAADRVFNLLPADQAAELRALWDEFEARRTPEAQFAAALDRLQPLLHNYQTGGRVWQENRIVSDQVRRRMRPMRAGAPPLWRYAAELILKAVKKGFLKG
jgi:putative hydrolase of HD superfamily